jgi:hypothetical protein
MASDKNNVRSLSLAFDPCRLRTLLLSAFINGAASLKARVRDLARASGWYVQRVTSRESRKRLALAELTQLDRPVTMTM